MTFCSMRLPSFQNSQRVLLGNTKGSILRAHGAPSSSAYFAPGPKMLPIQVRTILSNGVAASKGQTDTQANQSTDIHILCIIVLIFFLLLLSIFLSDTVLSCTVAPLVCLLTFSEVVFATKKVIS